MEETNLKFNEPFPVKKRNVFSIAAGEGFLFLGATMNFKHGLCYHPLYGIWTDMRKRCLSPTSRAYKNYGGRGIEICKRWDDFGLFVKDMGERPDGYTIERIDNNGNYCPKNCKWIPRNKQAANQRQRLNWYIKGKIFKTSIEASKLLNIARCTVWRWCKDQNKPDCYSEKRF